VVLAAARQHDALPRLMPLAQHDDDAVVAEHARWAADQIATQSRPSQAQQVLAGSPGDSSVATLFATVAAAMGVAGLRAGINATRQTMS